MPGPRLSPILNGKPTTEAPGRAPGKPWSYRDVAAFWGVSERHVAGLAAEMKIRTIRIGGRVFVPDDEARRVAREGTN